MSNPAVGEHVLVIADFPNDDDVKVGHIGVVIGVDAIDGAGCALSSSIAARSRSSNQYLDVVRTA